MLTTKTAASERVWHGVGPQTTCVKGWWLKISSVYGHLQSNWLTDIFFSLHNLYNGFCVHSFSFPCSHFHGCVRVHHEKAQIVHLPCLWTLYRVDSNCMCLPVSVISRSVASSSLRPARLLCPWDSPGKEAGISCHCLLQGIFPTRDRAWVSCTGRRILNHWATGKPMCVHLPVCLSLHLSVKIGAFSFIRLSSLY